MCLTIYENYDKIFSMLRIIGDFDLINEIENLNKTVGIKQSAKAIREGKAAKAYIAKDADFHIIDPFVCLCGENSVPVEYCDSCVILGRACGITVGAAVAVVLR